MEIRQNTIPMTAATTQTPLKLEGYAVVFDKPTIIGNYLETISRSALNNCDMSDCCLIYNHDLNRVPLARVPNTLTLETDQRGLKFSAILPDTEEGKAIYQSVQRGDLRGCSFAFNVADDNFENGTREIRSISKIFELSICPFPAYSDTTVEARNKNINEKKETSTMSTENNNTENQSFTLGENAQTLLRNVAGINAADAVKHFDAETVLGTAEYRSGFYKSLQGKELTPAENAAMKVAKENFAKRSNEFNTATNSAALIPTETLNEIIGKARTEGGLLAECRGFSIPANVSIPVATPKDRAAWHTEGAAVESEKIDTTSVTFANNEILKVFSMSLKSQAMTISAFESYLAEELRNCVMDTLQYTLINGTGEGQGTGLMTAFDSDNTVETAGAGIAYDDIVNLFKQLKRGYTNGAKFAMNRTTLAALYKLKDGDQRPLLIQDIQNGGVTKIFGYDIVVDDYLPDSTIIFGNFRYMAYNLPQGIVIESSRESSFKSGLIDYRAICLADTKPLLNEAFVKLIPKQS